MAHIHVPADIPVRHLERSRGFSMFCGALFLIGVISLFVLRAADPARAEQAYSANWLFFFAVAEGAMIGVRIRRASGSDATCDSPERDDFLSLAVVCDDAGTQSVPDASIGGYELTIPAVQGPSELTIRLSDPIDDVNVLELDLVRRRESSGSCSGGDA